MSNTVRVVLTVVICTALLIVWQYFFAKRPKPPAGGTGSARSRSVRGGGAKGSAAKGSAASKAGSSSGSSAAAGGSGSGSGSAGAGSGAGSAAKKAGRDPKLGPVTLSSEGKQTTIKLKHAKVTFSDNGGTLRHWVLLRKEYTETRDGEVRQIDLVQTPRRKGPWQLVTTFPESDFKLPQNARFTLVKRGDKSLTYRWSSAKVEVTKTYTLTAGPNATLDFTVKNKSDKALAARLRVALHSYQDPSTGKTGFANPYPRLATGLCHVNGELQRRNASAIRGTQSSCSAAGCGMGKGPVRQVGEVSWVGTDDRYFLTALVPKGADRNRRCEVRMLKGSKSDVVQVSVQFAEKKIAPGKSLERRFTLFIGAKVVKALDEVKAGAGGAAALADSIEFGDWLQYLARPMLALLRLFQSLVGNWGLAIILLTLVVKGLTLYPTHRSMKSMKAMQKLKPKIDEIREKYKNDKQRMNQEMMSFYKLHKISPFGGCLPMVIQMPIWFALYRTLGNAVELYHSPFFGWITDLTAPDRYYILPILMGASMFAQQLVTPNPSMSGGQAKLMKYFMPGMFTVMMLWLPAGLTLYIFVNTLLTFAHQLYMNKKEDGDALGRGGDSGGGSSGGGGAERKSSSEYKPKLSARASSKSSSDDGSSSSKASSSSSKSSSTESASSSSSSSTKKSSTRRRRRKKK